MNKIFTCLLVSSLTFLATKSFAQEEKHFKCGAHVELNKMLKEHPDLAKIIASNEAKTQQNLKQKSVDDSTVYTIPVVFHIVHQNGDENISDAQVKNAMSILNRDFRMLNADTTEILPVFDSIKADAKIEFKLACKDPWGNCTNGIEHIYSNLTNKADNASKIHFWDRSKYLNVWVVKTIGSQGTAGYSQYPSAVDNYNHYADGVIILHDYIGSIGTGDDYTSRALTHEVGHWLNLSHTWGDDNDPEVATSCKQDDHVTDTPITIGTTNCLGLHTDNTCNDLNPAPGILTDWTFDVVDNVQNYMDYSYCSVMFSEGQVARMREALNSSVAHRNNLITPDNHAWTGIHLDTPLLCTPKAEFKSNKKYVCKNGSVTFTDISWNAQVDSREWVFEGGNPATSTSPNPTVSYNTEGFKKVTLTVTNAAGSNTIEGWQYIYVGPEWTEHVGPYSEDFSGNNYFLAENDIAWSPEFKISENGGWDNSRCYVLRNYKDVENAIMYSDDYFYYDRLGYSRDGLISASYDLSNTSNVSVSFKYALATNATQSADILDSISVYVSKDCGASWTNFSFMDVPKNQLITGGYANYTDFKPVNNGQYRTFSFNYTPTVNDKRTRFKIVYSASDYASNLYIDNFNVEGTLGLFANEAENLELNVYPNPTKSDQNINVNYHAGNNPVKFTLRDIQGKIISEETVSATNTEVNHVLNTNGVLNSSCYFLEVKTGEFTTTKKIIILE